MSAHGSRLVTIRRRLISVPMLMLLGLALLVLLPIWLPVAFVYDLVRAPRRLPITRLMLFALCWAWMEIGALVRLSWVWITGRGGDMVHMTKVQGWWAGLILGALRRTAGLRVEVEGADSYQPVVDRCYWHGSGTRVICRPPSGDEAQARRSGSVMPARIAPRVVVGETNFPPRSY